MNDLLPNDLLASVRAWVLDVDGCLMRTSRAGGSGGTPMPEAVRLVASLKAAGHTVVVCTNASQQPPARYSAHLRSQGFDVEDHEFVTAGSAAADYVKARHPDARVLAVGDEGLRDPLRRLGITPVDPRDTGGPADVVVVGGADLYRTEDLNAAALAVEAGAPLYVTVDVRWFHGGVGKSISASSVIAAAIGWAGGARPQVLGKPSPALADTLVRRLDLRPEQMAVVGDSLIEVRLARHMGARAVLVLSGATTAARLDALGPDELPDLVLADVAELHRLLTSRSPHPEGATP